MAWDSGAGHYFYFLLCHRLALNIFPLPVTTAKLELEQVSSITIGEVRRMDVRALPILSCSLCCTNTIGAAIQSPLIGEAQRIKKNPRKLLIGAANLPRFAYWHSEGAPL